MVNNSIDVKNLFLRLPRFSFDLYEKLAFTDIEHLSDTLLENQEYLDFINLIKDDNPLLFSKLQSKNLDKKEATSLLNYFMRASTRCSPYKKYSGYLKANVGDITNIFNNNIKIDEDHVNREETFSNIPNPFIKRVKDIIHLPLGSKIIKIENQAICKKIEKGIIKNEDLNLFKKLRLNYKRSNLSPYNDENQLKRTRLNITSKHSTFSEDELINLSQTLMELRSLSDSSASKGLLWLDRLRKELFDQHHTYPVKLKDIINGSPSFRVPANKLLNDVMTVYSPFKRIVADILTRNHHEVILQSDDIEKLKKFSHRPHLNLSRDFTILFEKVKTDNTYFINYFRSSYLGTRPIAEYVKKLPEKYLEVYKNSDVIFADLIFTTEKNILQKRPVSTSYAISIDGSPGHNSQRIIDYDDLLIHASPNEIILFSKSLNKRIIPVMTSCYLGENDENPHIRFLVTLASQYFTDGNNFDLHSLRMKTIPRVKYKNVIISPKTWHISKQEISTELKNLPKYFRLVDGDRYSIIIRDSIYALDQLLKCKSDILHITEYFGLDNPINTPNGRYINEVAMSIYQIEKLPVIPFKHYRATINFSQELKQLTINAPADYLDYIIEDIINNFLDKKDYYFIKYQFPTSQIRLRIFEDTAFIESLANHVLNHDNYKQYSISNAFISPFENELSTYVNEDGLKQYLKASILLSKCYLKIRKTCKPLHLGCNNNGGPLAELIFLAYFSKQLLNNATARYKDTKLSSNQSYKETKHVWEIYRRLKKEKNIHLLRIEALATNLAHEVQQISKSWKEATSHIEKKDAYFFENRIIHMEIFRLTNGTFKDSNNMILKIANNIYKLEESYVKRLS